MSLIKPINSEFKLFISYNEFTKENHITVNQTGTTSLIYFKDIIFIKSESNYSCIHLKNGKSIFTSKSLKHWCDVISDSNFIRVHASYFINRIEIVSIEKGRSKIAMSNGMKVGYSRSFDIKSLLNNNSKISK